ncbi:MAG: GNAT family N-acetyltransferase [Bacteroidetes bacterium]|nr:GNAT family N-acetyltransferase [Bacteroidota bacterium]
MSTIHWSLLKFESLTSIDCYEILQLRSAIFVVEQQCVYLDMDNKDQQSWHLLGKIDGQLAAYTRLLPAGLAFTHCSIGRVVTASTFRRAGLGKLLMAESIQCCEKLFGKGPIEIGAQLYLEKFYQSFGFNSVGEIYLEDGIEHIHMIRMA